MKREVAHKRDNNLCCRVLMGYVAILTKNRTHDNLYSQNGCVIYDTKRVISSYTNRIGMSNNFKPIDFDTRFIIRCKIYHFTQSFSIQNDTPILKWHNYRP